MNRVRILAGRVVLTKVGGNPLVFPKEYIIVYDPSGRSLDKCSFFVGPADFTDEPINRKTKFDVGWYGGDYELRRAIVDVPDEGWHPIAEVDEILYFRPGEHEGDWVHRYSEPQPLYRSRRWHMIVLPGDCRITRRGFEAP